MVKECVRGKIEGVFIHHTADIEEPVYIGEGSKIWRFCHVESHARIGKQVMLGMGCHVSNGVEIGDYSRLQDYCVLYRGVKIGNACFLGPRVTFTNVKVPKIFRRAKFYDTIVENNVTIGAGSVIICGITIGEHSFIGAGSVITKDIPPYSLVIGNPGRIIKTLSRNWEEFDGK